jgi:hypothetical protein
VRVVVVVVGTASFVDSVESVVPKLWVLAKVAFALRWIDPSWGWVVVVATADRAGSSDYWDLIVCSPSGWLESAIPR